VSSHFGDKEADRKVLSPREARLHANKLDKERVCTEVRSTSEVTAYSVWYNGEAVMHVSQSKAIATAN